MPSGSTWRWWPTGPPCTYTYNMGLKSNYSGIYPYLRTANNNNVNPGYHQLWLQHEHVVPMDGDPKPGTETPQTPPRSVST